ncbi:kanosamine kinase [Sphaerisporangium krabiense]|uniref:Kanosamine 6-kinase n=1 Tax=Sphaerisporangium krabiense TaxID=763782 RepID=A0A7W8Z6T7_9ACTN|nr:ROK family protein [Sphaerisporangium krabiense]MBB5628451.1 kanosamine 6-kinase [Sphaerisporangium krabiense]GII66810.1 kanosamine kinase [Sphaerisporangium krabiense]
MTSGHPSTAPWVSTPGTYLGIDIGGTKVAARMEVGNTAYEAEARWPPYAPDPERDLAVIGDLVERLGPRDRCAAVGVASAATLDGGGRVVAWPNRPSWIGFDLVAALRSRLGTLIDGAPVHVADDGGLAALAEAHAVRCPDLAYLGVGTGVGGGLVMDGELFAGGAAVELGHLIVHPGGPACACGRDGCLQATASGPATLRRAAARRGAPVTAEELVTAADQGEAWAAGTLAQTARALALAVTSLTEIVRPRRIHIGGGFGAAAPGLVPGVAAHVATLARTGRPAPLIAPAALGPRSSLLGALLYARNAQLVEVAG